jgi:hypothetical protein
MSRKPEGSQEPVSGLKEMRYSLKELLREVQRERDSSTIGQEMIDQSEIENLFSRKQKARRGQRGE